MNEIISEEDALTDHFLHSFCLLPRLAISVVDGAVGPVEGDKDAKLIRLDVEILCWDALITWDIHSTEELPCHAITKQLID